MGENAAILGEVPCLKEEILETVRDLEQQVNTHAIFLKRLC